MNTASLLRRAAAVCLSLLLFACPKPPVECIEGDEAVCDGGTLPPDYCNSREEADSDSAHCHAAVNDEAGSTRLTDVFISRLLDGGIDKDWYLAQMPALTPRSLLHINGGYSGVQQTAVNFSITVLKDQADGGMVAIANGLDRHGTAAPKAVDLVVPFAESNAKLYVLVGDEGAGTQVKVDNRNPYSLFVQVRENPDSNEPNDMTPTPISLTAGTAGAMQGTASGYLATNDDVDLYSFQVSGSSRQIIYLHITGPSTMPIPTPVFGRLAFVMFDPMMQPIAEGQMDNDGLAIDLATARLASMPGTYTVRVSGYKAPNTSTVVKGDLTLKYDVGVQLLPDLDANEPNDTITTAKALNPSPNSTTSLTGKLSYVPDEEWFLVNLPARPTPSVLRYKTTVAMGGGRFSPLSGVATRQLRAMTKVTMGTTASDRQQTCITNRVACPKGFDDPSSSAGLLVQDVCKNTNPTQCLLAQRNEEPLFKELKNLVGAIPIEANKATELYIMFRDEGRGRAKYADDRDWTIQLEWADDPDEAARLAGPTQIPPNGTAAGLLTFGYGEVLDPFDINTGDGVRAPQDYDAYTTDRDLFEFGFGGATGEQSWSVEWELSQRDGGPSPADIALELTFCSGAGPGVDGGLCPGEIRRTLAYSGDRLTPWYLPMTFGNAQVLFDRRLVGSATVVRARPNGCWCFSAPRVAAGRFFANVAGVNRVSNEPLRYTIRQGIAAYPANFTSADGGTASCPVVDAGCGFAR